MSENKLCKRCGGEGITWTGIDEIPTAHCELCDGTGFEKGYVAKAELFMAPVSTAPETAAQGEGQSVSLAAYDAGYLSNAGGGDVSWWQDYIRAELGRAHEHYQVQHESELAALRAQLAEREEQLAEERRQHRKSLDDAHDEVEDLEIQSLTLMEARRSLRRQLAATEAQYQTMKGHYEAAVDSLAASEARERELAGQIAKYGQHLDFCGIEWGNKTCTCGLGAALASRTSGQQEG